MRLTKLLIVIFILSLPLGQLARLPFTSEGLNLYIYDALVPAILFVWFVYVFGIRKKVFIPPLFGFVSIFAFISSLSILNALRWLNPNEFFVSGSYWIRWIMYAGLYFVVYDLVWNEFNSIRSTRQKKNVILSEAKNPPSIVRRSFVPFDFAQGPQNDGRNSVNFITNLLILSGVILAFLGFLQLIFIPDFKHLAESSGWDPHKNRLASTFLDPNFCGAYLVLTLNLILSKILCFRHPELDSGSKRTGSETNQMLKRVQHDKAVLWYTTTFCLVATALLLTFSRSAWLMFAVSIFVIGILKSRKLLIAAFIIAFCAYYFVPRVQTRIANVTDPADSASKRIISWQRTWDIAKESLITGVGFNAFRYAQKEQGYFEAGELGGRSGAGSDSSILLVLATTGIFGLLAYLTLYGKIALDALLGLRHSEESRAESRGTEESHPISQGILRYAQDDDRLRSVLSLALLASLAGLFVESNFINSLFYTQIMAWIWIMVGLSYGVREVSLRGAERSRKT